MNIGFDFDKVFVDYPPLIPYSLVDFLYKGRSYFKRTTENGKMHYRYPGSVEQKVRIFTHYPIFRPILKSNFAELKKISKSGHFKTYLISSRYGFLKGMTGKLIDKYKFNKYFDGVFFNFESEQPHIFKEQTIRKLDIETYIDDDIHLSIYLSKKIPKLKIFWVSGNRKPPLGLPSNIIPIKNLRGLEKKLNA